MVNAREWLNEKIPEDQRARVTHLHIYGYSATQHVSAVPTNKFNNITLEGELNLNSFVNLEELCIAGNSSSKQQKLTSLKIDKCNKLTTLTITYTTLGYLSLPNRANYKNINLSNIPQIMFDDNILKNQVERLINTVRNVKSTDISDLKLEAKKIEEEYLEYQLATVKDKFKHQFVVTNENLNKDNQSWLEVLVEAQQEVLQGSNAFARKLIEKIKKQLSNALTDEEIQNILGKKVEINELEIQIKNLKIQEQETSK
ncbi:2420_t:CDS:1 [Racocetra fulgida]|uniref:2420_t:CDS:1 n=1 Tax=Racocetra fulgida TaxID=60492 RepID=A0A9N8WN69_9GLOM|nr:2420_t:CDS:1 [Racocetra fulgida]